MIGRYFIGARRDTSSVYVTDDAGHVLALCEDRDYAEMIVTALNAYQGEIVIEHRSRADSMRAAVLELKDAAIKDGVSDDVAAAIAFLDLLTR